MTIVSRASKRRRLRRPHTEPGESPRLVAYEEKPETSLTVSMGIYVMSRTFFPTFPSGYFDSPHLVQALLDAGLQVGTFPCPHRPT